MYARPNPCTPQRHHGGGRRRKALEGRSRMKASTGPLLKDPSRMKAPTGGYAGGLDCSHSQTALAEGPAAKTTERGKRLDPDTQDPAHPEGSAPVPLPASRPTGKNATSERGKCHSGTLGPVAKMPLPATRDATAHRKIPASPGVHSQGPVEGDFPPFQLRNYPTCIFATDVISLYTPKASRKGSPTQGPVGPLICAPPQVVMPGAWVVHTPW